MSTTIETLDLSSNSNEDGMTRIENPLVPAPPAPQAPQAPQAPPARARKSIVPKVPKLLGPKELEYRLLQNELTLADLEDWCAAHQQPDPSTLNAARQAQLLAWLDNAGASKVHDWWDQKRKAIDAMNRPDEGDGENRD